MVMVRLSISLLSSSLLFYVTIFSIDIVGFLRLKSFNSASSSLRYVTAFSVPSSSLTTDIRSRFQQNNQKVFEAPTALKSVTDRRDFDDLREPSASQTTAHSEPSELSAVLTGLSGRNEFVRSAIPLSMIAITTMTSFSLPSRAYDKLYPAELRATDSISKPRQSARLSENPDGGEGQQFAGGRSVGGSIAASTLWGGALWLWSGSRSTPIATPLANAIYRRENEEWLRERNDGWFAALPWEFLVILGAIFVGCGYALDLAVCAATESNAVSIQLAAVLLIAGGTFELGRIFSGEKLATKEESVRSERLNAEFQHFADQRLIVAGGGISGGSIHRSEIVSAFRRFYSKYRVRPEDLPDNSKDSDSYAASVTDLEIERLLREWAATKRGLVDMTSAGFYNGVQINKDADVFVSR